MVIAGPNEAVKKHIARPEIETCAVVSGLPAVEYTHTTVHTELEAGVRVRLKHNPGRIGVVTGRIRKYGGLRNWQISFPEGVQYAPEDQLELVGEGGDDPLDLLDRGRLADGVVLRRTITHARLTGRLADVIYSMDTTGTDFYAHQFKPVVSLMNSAGRGLLIADEVGLGKTIEAGLIWTELRTRYDFRRLLVLCPAVLREKWQRELHKRFGVDAEIMDARRTLTQLRLAQEQRYTASFAIIASLQGLRPNRGWDERDPENSGASSRLAQFLEDRSEDDPLVDLCVIDEAHYLRNRETMTASLGRLARSVSDFILLLSATPIHLRSEDLYVLLNLVDEDTFNRPQAFDDILRANKPLVRARDLALSSSRIADAATSLRQELVQASKNPLLSGSEQLRALINEEVWRSDLSRVSVVARLAERLERVNLLGHVVTRTRKRDVEERRVIRDVKAAFVKLTPVERAFYESVTATVRDYCMVHDAHEGFLQVTPQRQMSSSMPAALASWLHGETIDGEDPDDDERPLRAELFRRARKLGDLTELRRHDSKYEKLQMSLQSLLSKDRREKVVVFSYFRATLRYLSERLERDSIRSIVLHGGTADKDGTVLEFCNSHDHRVLLSSEVGSEGIDLQFARIVINYDLPWNPMRVEQRIGRIDRLGQRAEKIHVLNLLYDDTIDSRIYKRLFMRLGIFEGVLGSLEPVLGDTIQKLETHLFSRNLTPEQEEERIEQTGLALEQRRRMEDKLEAEATSLTAYGDYILNQVKAARDLKRSISARDICSYIIDFMTMHYRGTEFREVANDPMRFQVNLSIEARHDLNEYLREQRLQGSTRLVRDTIGLVPCRFENTAVPDLNGREEVISQFHPLVRFVGKRLSEPDLQSRPAVAVRLPAQGSTSELDPGRYAFSVQRWSVQGLRDMERLYYAASALEPSPDGLQAELAEHLIVTAAKDGEAWLGAHRAVDLLHVVGTVEECCIAPSDKEFESYIADRKAENNDRARIQGSMLDDQYRTQLGRLEAVLQRHQNLGRDRLVKATRGRLRALDRRVERRRKEIDERARLQYSSEVVCVGIIEVEECPRDSCGRKTEKEVL